MPSRRVAIGTRSSSGRARSPTSGAARSARPGPRRCASCSTSSTTSRRTISRVHFYASAREHTEATDPETNDLATLARDRALRSREPPPLRRARVARARRRRGRRRCSQRRSSSRTAHRLRVAREEKPYVLPEGEEQALNARRPAISAWESLHGRELATLTIEFDGGDGPEPHTIDRLLSYVHDPDRELRLAALDVLYEALDTVADVQAACYDALVGDRLSVDRLRGIPDADVADEPAQRARRRGRRGDDARDRGALSARPPLVRPQGRGRSGSTGSSSPTSTRRSAATAGSSGPRRSRWSTSRCATSTRGWATSSARASTAATSTPSRAPARSAARYCASISKTVLPYVLMNFTDQLRDVVTLAHEFGHVVHGTLSLERQTYSLVPHGLAVAEVPSTFAQLLAVERLIEQEEDPVDARDAARRPRRERDGVDLPPDDDGALRAAAVRAARRGEGADERAALRDVWLEENERYYADSLELPRGLPARLVVHPALHPRSLLHVRVLVRASRRVLARSRGTARIPSASRRRISTSSPPSGSSARRRSCSRRSASTCAIRRRGRGLRRVRPLRCRGRSRRRRLGSI